MRGPKVALLGGVVVIRGLPNRQYVVHLAGGGHPAESVGGKAASLDALARTGVPVPPAVALTATAYHAFVTSAGLTETLDDVESRRIPEPWEIADETKEIETAFAAAPMSEDVRAALFEAWSAVGRGHALAVRSSATVEDGAGASFAGQHLSVLGVRTEEELEDAVRRVWASLWHPASRAYRARMGIAAEDLAMPVIVQVLVPAELSGVCFTSDPTAAGLVRIEAVAGLGEALVSGQATPDVYRLTIGGLHTVGPESVPPILRRVAKVALDIAAHTGVPQDVEWSVVGRRVWILQSRPITTIHEAQGDGFDTPLRPDDLYTPVGVAEMLPGVLSPLLWTINGPMVEEAFRRLLDDIGALPGGLAASHALVGRYNGRAVLNLSLLRDASRRATGDSGAEVERQYLGYTLTEETTARPSRSRRIRALLSAMKGAGVRRQAEKEGEDFEAAVEAVTQLASDLNSLTTHELLAYRSRVRDLATAGIAAEAAVAAAAAASYRSLEVMLESWIGDAGREWTQRVTRSTETAVDPVAVTVEALTRSGAGPDELARLETLAGAATPRAAQLQDDRLLAVLASDLDDLGSSNVYAGPTWGERLGYLVPLALRIPSTTVSSLKASPDDDLEALVTELKSTWRWRTQRILTGQLVDVRVRLLRRVTEDARRLLARREKVKAAVLRLGGRECRLIQVLGERLVAIGAIGSSDDVELLTDWEVDEVLLGTRTIVPEVLAARKRALDRYRAEPELPNVINSTGVSPSLGASDEIAGWAASPGLHRGRVRVAFDLESAAALQPGEVLVSPATDPSWTPLLMVAGAIVVERGGPLSHAAIVSRELGLPAVLNVPGATQVLRTGDLVEVDGSTGRITVIDEEAA